LHDLGCLIFFFVFSSIRKLRFNQCKNLLEKIEELENLANERQNAAANIKTPPAVSPRLTKQPSLPQVPSTNINTFLNSAKLGKNLAGKKVPNLSLKTLIPGIFASKTDNKLNARLPSEPLCKPRPNPLTDKVLYK